MQKNKRDQKGITLIALIITIIILLILSGISIATLTGNNGVLNKANQAGEETKKKEYEEILKVIANGLRSDKVTNQWDHKTYLDEIEKEIKKEETFRQAEVTRKNAETIEIVTVEKYIYKVTENEIKYLKQKDENLIATGLIGAIQEISENGYHEVAVNGVSYKIHLYYFEEDQDWSGEHIFGDENDVGSESEEATRMVVVKVDGDLTLQAEAIVKPYHTAYGGPKGFFVYCTGTLTNNSGYIINNVGAKATGENIYLWENKDGSYETVPAVGAIGGAKYSAPNSIYSNGYWYYSGTSGTDRMTGGGGSGGGLSAGISGAGSTGTSYSGGTGGGGGFNHVSASDGAENGGAGGNGNAKSFYTWGVGGGAGNPGGSGMSNAGPGSNGTGGLLIIYANTIINNGTIHADGSVGGWAYRAGGGGSGGGSVNIFYRKESTLGTITANAGAGGAGTRGGGETTRGGLGGAGTVTKGSVETGDFVVAVE